MGRRQTARRSGSAVRRALQDARQLNELEYARIGPGRPARNGRAPSRQNLRTWIQTHHGGNAEGSTLRKTLGCLLADELRIELRRVGSGTRRTFVQGEEALSVWMANNAFVSWLICEHPWTLEDELITSLELPLNLDGSSRHQFHPVLSQARRRCVARA